MNGFTIPTLRTPRLTLRAFRPEDLPAYAAMLGDLRVAQFLGAGKARSEAESWEAMARALGQWALLGYGLFAVEHGRHLIGHAGVLNPPNWPQPEIAYAIAPDAQRHGFASEAANAVRSWAAHAHGLRDLVSYIRPTNTASIGVVRKLGAMQLPDIEILGIQAQVWRHATPSDQPPALGAPTVIDVPALETKRFVLRRFVHADYARLCEIHADAETMLHLGDGKPRDKQLTWAQISMWTGAHALARGGWFAITRRGEDRLIGRSGVNAQPAWPEPELAYTIDRAHWGEGIASEAAAAVRDWAWHKLKPATLVSLVKSGNEVSARVAAKLGARLTGTLTFEEKLTERWEYPRSA
jgi:RimJ/RimL family protein N-acetyltransferase